MDPISHAVFGGNLAHAIRGKKYGSRVTIYSMLASMSPDIDIIPKYIPQVDPMWAMFFHRTLTHSLPFAAVVSPIAGYIMSRLFKKMNIPWYTWGLITFLSMTIGHLFLDRCTTYGIRLLWPFVDVGYEARIINVIDFFYTIPLIGLIIRYLIISKKKQANGSYMRKPRVRFIGITFAGLYLGMMALQQYSLKKSLAHDMVQAEVAYKNVFATPQFLQPFLWYGMVETAEGTYKLNYSSVFDSKPRTYQTIPGNHELADNVDNTTLQRFIRRSNGWYQLESEGDDILFRDLRFGRLLGWDKTTPEPMMFSYAVNPTTNVVVSHHKHTSNQEIGFPTLWQKHWQRVRGN